MNGMDKIPSYVYFVNERESVRMLKEIGAPRPWTEDEVIDKYRFCNMRRRDDRVSKWLIDNLYKPYANSPNLWLTAALARWVNWPPALQDVIETGVLKEEELSDAEFDLIGNTIDQRVKRGEKAWTGAYMITARTLPKDLGKGLWIARTTLKPLWDRRSEFEAFFGQPPEQRSVQEAMKLFKGRFNHGTFMAGQIVADWTYTHLLDQASDLQTYAPAGPGSTRGMNYLQDRPFDKLLSQERFVDELVELIDKVKNEIIGSETFTAHDYQNTLCEYSKWVRVNNGGSKPRSLYAAETRF